MVVPSSDHGPRSQTEPHGGDVLPEGSDSGDFSDLGRGLSDCCGLMGFPIDEIEGRIATTLFVVYPPGIATIVPGERVGSFEAPFGRVGLSICYDLRFPELFRAMGDCTLIVVPAA